MSLNTIVRNNIRLMEELTTMPFRVAQDFWNDTPNNNDSTFGNAVNRSLNIMQQLTSMPFEIALEFFEADQPQGQQQTATAVAATTTTQNTQNTFSGPKKNVQNEEYHFPPYNEH